MENRSGNVQIPMFPLALLPLPGELVPLHIFEPRYQQLLQDAANNDIIFGIYFSHEINVQKLGSLMMLESVIKRYPGGESDVIVKCIENFKLEKLYRLFKSKLYPGGDVQMFNEKDSPIQRHVLYDLFAKYMLHRKITNHFTASNIFQIANELSLDLYDRYSLLTASSSEKKEKFLITHLKFQLHILNQEERSKNVFHLN